MDATMQENSTTKQLKKVTSPFWSTSKKSIKELMNLKNQGKLDSTMSYQRKAGIGKWNKQEYIDNLIDSILRGWYIQGFQWRVSDGGYEIVDSLQRTTTISRIYSDLHVPKFLKPPFDHLNGKLFSLWPSEDQQAFLDMKIEVVLIVEKDEEKVIEYFTRTNGGVPLTNAQAKRGMFAKTLVLLEDVLHHEIWDRPVVKLDMSQRETILMQLINSMENEEPDHNTRKLVDWFVEWEPNKKVIKKISDKLDVLDRVLDVGFVGYDEENATEEAVNDIKVIRRFCKKVHLEAILYCLQGNESGELVGIIYSNLVRFFGVPRSERPQERADYVNVTYQDTSSKQSITERHNIMEKVIQGKIEYPSDIKKSEGDFSEIVSEVVESRKEDDSKTEEAKDEELDLGLGKEEPST